jgi:transcriptional regulator with XRE-family HTH domain
MKNLNDKIKEITSKTPSNWKRRAEFRKNNRWLIYSAKIASRILAAIETKSDVNQAKIAKELQVSPQHVSKIVQGKENLTLESIYKISQVLGVELISFPEYKDTYDFIIPQKYDMLAIEGGSENQAMKIITTQATSLTYFGGYVMYAEVDDKLRMSQNYIAKLPLAESNC